jgi:hypothetical protein
VTEEARKQGREVGGIGIRSASWLAWSVCTLSLALTALGYLVIARNLSLDAPVYFYWLEPTTIAIGYSVIGAIIASRLPDHPIGWICCAIGFMGAVEHFSSEYAIYALVAHPEALVGGKLMLWLSTWVWIVMFGLIVYLILLFPNGRLPSSRWRWFAWLSVALTLLAAILMAISPDAALDVLGSSGNGHITFPNPLGIEGLPNLYRPVQTLVLALGLVGAASVVVGRRGARGVERQQIKWLLYAGAIFFAGPTFQITVSYVVRVEGSWALWVGNFLGVVSGLGVPVAIGFAILRYRLYEIDTLINRTLVYGSLTATLVALYFGVIVVLQRLFVLLTGQQSTLAVVASTLLIAALFTPFRHRIQSFIDRRFYRRKYDARKTLEAFSIKLRYETDLEALNLTTWWEW